jgi:hypothetical protein
MSRRPTEAPNPTTLDDVHAELRLVRERLDALVGELRANRSKAVKRQRTVARKAVERVESVPVTELHRQQARKVLRRLGLR